MSNDRTRDARLHFGAIATIAALGQLLAWSFGSTAALHRSNPNISWLRSAEVVWLIVTPMQWAAVVAWALVTGGLVAWGAWRRESRALLPFTALCAGALIPLGLTMLVAVLARTLPAAPGSGAQPVVTLTLVAYALIVPWLLGRLVSRPKRDD